MLKYKQCTVEYSLALHEAKESFLIPLAVQTSQAFFYGIDKVDRIEPLEQMQRVRQSPKHI